MRDPSSEEEARQGGQPGRVRPVRAAVVRVLSCGRRTRGVVVVLAVNCKPCEGGAQEE